MSKIKRKIIKIDEDRCDGCGACIPSCKEGALQIVDGKAKLVSEIYCDGLGACLGDCPRGALTLEERDAEEFDEVAVEKRVEQKLGCGCPGSMARTISREPTQRVDAEDVPSELRQWPVQLALIPAMAPYLKGADLVLLADCTAVAYANLHQHLIKGKVIAMACPKLDEADPYIEKLAQMMKLSNFKSIEIVMMEVPCCSGLSFIVEQARDLAGVDIEIKKTIINIEGGVV
jgi:NAD-dependent dihydropyrimidine dehydrogenase PreA subunit